jgi:hypothetical protein
MILAESGSNRRITDVHHDTCRAGCAGRGRRAGGRRHRDLHSSYDFRWPASGRGGPASFDGVIDGGTGRFRAAHGWFHYQTLPNGHEQIAVTISGDG